MKEEIQVKSSATKAVADVFAKEQLDEFIGRSIKMIGMGRPKMDGRTNVAACHYYNTEHGKVATLATWIKGSPISMYVGTEKEINEMKKEFYKAVEDAGFSVKKTPRERAEDRRRQKKGRK